MALITASPSNFQKLLDLQKASLEHVQSIRELMTKEAEASGSTTDENQEEMNRRLDENNRLLKIIADNTGGGGKRPEAIKPAADSGAAGGGMLSGLAGGMKALGDTAKGLLALAAALWITSKAMQEFADVSWESLAKGLIVMGGLVIATKFIEETGAHKTLLALGAALLITAVALEKFGEVDWESLLKGGLVLTGLVVAAIALGGAGPAMLIGAASLLVLGGALWLTAEALTTFAEVEWESIGKAVVALLALGGVAALLGTVAPALILGSVGILALGVGLLAASVGLKNFADLDWDTISKAGVAIAALGVIAAGLGLVAPAMLLAGIGLTSLGVGLMSVGTGLKTMADLEFETIGKAAVAIGALGVVAGAIGLLAPVMLIAGAGLAALGVGLMSVGTGLKTMADLEWETIGTAVVAIGAMVAVGSLAGVLSPLLILGAYGLGAISLALLPFAAAMEIAGPAFDAFANAMDKLSKIDGANLLKVGAGLVAVGAGMAAFGASQAVAGLGSLVGGFLTAISGQKSPVEQIEQMSQAGTGLEKAGIGIKSVSEGMAAFSNIKPETLRSVDEFPWMKATAFAAAGGVMKVQTGEQTVVVGRQSAENRDSERQMAGGGGGSTSIVNAPTNINRSTTSMEYRMPIRNPESSVLRYIDSRYGTA